MVTKKKNNNEDWYSHSAASIWCYKQWLQTIGNEDVYVYNLHPKPIDSTEVRVDKRAWYPIKKTEIDVSKFNLKEKY